MSRVLGTVSRGIRLPIIKSGEQKLESIIIDSLKQASIESNTNFKDKDIICITESLVARAANNYVTIDDIANEIKQIFGENATIGVLYPIYSRNRFSMILKGIAKAAKKVVIQLHEGKDEVGNDLVNPFTNIDIIEFYKSVVLSENAECEIITSDSIFKILEYTKDIIISTIHTRFNDYNAIIQTHFFDYKGIVMPQPNKVITLDKICCEMNNKHGYNTLYGVLGSNKATDNSLKLFPNKDTCKTLCDNIQKYFKDTYDVNIEVMVYGDGCFKDPVGGIWEFADPVVAPYATDGLKSSPNELKIKYLTDNENMSTEDIKNAIKDKDNDLKGNMLSEGTTPRRYSDLVGSLADLTSGSGDKGTPVIWISGYFDNYNDD